MNQRDVTVERVRMALAEAGYPNARVGRTDIGTVWIDLRIPYEITWRAQLVANAPTVSGLPGSCLECYVFLNVNGITRTTAEERGWDCLARGEGIEDCGVDRGGS